MFEARQVESEVHGGVVFWGRRFAPVHNPDHEQSSYQG